MLSLDTPLAKSPHCFSADRERGGLLSVFDTNEFLTIIVMRLYLDGPTLPHFDTFLQIAPDVAGAPNFDEVMLGNLFGSFADAFCSFIAGSRETAASDNFLNTCALFVRASRVVSKVSSLAQILMTFLSLADDFLRSEDRRIGASIVSCLAGAHFTGGFRSPSRRSAGKRKS
jgi:hypothetical protein